MSAEPKPGWKSTEFYLALAAVVVGAVLAIGGDITSLFPTGSQEAAIVEAVVRVAGIAATILGALGYQVNRALVKTSAIKADEARTTIDGQVRKAMVERETAETQLAIVDRRAKGDGFGGPQEIA